MRVLIINSYEYPPNLLADSSFTLTYQLIKALPSSWDFLWVLPEIGRKGVRGIQASGEVTVPDNCEMLTTPIHAGRNPSELLVSDDLFKLINPVNGERVDYDVVFTNNGCVAKQLSNWFGVAAKRLPKPPIIVCDYSTPFNGTDCEQGYLKEDDDRLLTHYCGYRSAKLVYHMTPFSLRAAVRQTKKFFSPSVAKEVTGRFKLLPALFSEELAGVCPKEHQVVSRIYWGGRLTATKNVKMAVEVWDYLFSRGLNVNMAATVPVKTVNKNRLMVGRYRHWPAKLELESGLTQQQALSVMRDCQLSIFPQSLRFGPAAPLEQVSAGLVVLINGEGSGSVLPKEYPWYWKSKDELNVLLRKVIREYKSERVKLRHWQDFVRKELSIESNVGSLRDDILKVVAESEEYFVGLKSSLYRGRVDEFKSDQLWPDYKENLLRTHPTFRQIRNSFIPFRWNPSLWHVYKMLKVGGKL